ncbi:hypothetical protein R1flu_004323 [Riccia fluitans]|uniref:Uncharacterized protein n=1 Tax=Riccia fluitans TaxID=41844 RepID=A0ABD1YSX2_9MARC
MQWTGVSRSRHVASVERCNCEVGIERRSPKACLSWEPSTTGFSFGSLGRSDLRVVVFQIDRWVRISGGQVLSFSQQKAGELLDPGFRTAAALAGWDDEALMLAALNQSPAISAGSPNATNNGADFEVLPESPACRDRNRDKRMN